MSLAELKKRRKIKIVRKRERERRDLVTNITEPAGCTYVMTAKAGAACNVS